ncbi:thioesterase domain-containing protein [Streptomyces sp. NPDC047515]|uniref:thioesterase II family protein n=1 Tax=Streptomyces sp. NPDC047515 TaxID=3155380 RepID=UPI0033DF9F6A
MDAWGEDQLAASPEWVPEHCVHIRQHREDGSPAAERWWRRRSDPDLKVSGRSSGGLPFDAALGETADAGEGHRSGHQVVHPHVEAARWRVKVSAAASDCLPLAGTQSAFGEGSRHRENEELREMVTPALRSDLRAHATYEAGSDSKPLSCPVSCCHGVGDPLVEETRLADWAGVTSGEFRLRVRPGGHFHVAGDVAGLVSDILDRERT